MRQDRNLGRGRIAALILCFLIAAYFFSIIVFALANYELYAAAAPQFLRYVVGPGLIAIFFGLAGIFRPWRQAVMIAACGLAVLAPLFLFEAFLTWRTIPVHFASLGRLSEAQKAALDKERDMVRGFTLRSLNRRAGVATLADAVLSGFPRSRVLLCSPPEGIIAYSSDRLGFNNPDTVYDRPIDVLVMGDSFIEGFCLPPGKDVVGRLRSRDLNAVSMGIRGNGPLIELATLGRYGPTLKPRNVVMAFFTGNDWRNLGFELTEPWLRTALQPNADFGPANGAVSTIDRARGIVGEITGKQVTAIDLLRRKSVVRNFFALHLTGRSLGLTYPKVPPARPEYVDVLRRAKAITESWGGRFSVLYIPQVDRYYGLLPNGFVYDQSRNRVLSAARDAGVDVVDLVQEFRGKGNPLQYYAADAHFSEAGARLVADALVNHLGER